jgi:tRNA G18 (ribose-2'-O)-methylase SpoU
MTEIKDKVVLDIGAAFGDTAVLFLLSGATKVFAVEQTENAIMLDHFQPETHTKHALIFGNEVKGVSQEAINVCDGVIEIPQLGSKHSLNISVSAGIVIWDLFQKITASN